MGGMRQAELLRYLVLAAQREGNRQLTARLAEIDLTPAQSEALRILADHGPLALTGLGDMLVCDSGTNPSRLADRLVTAGLVERGVAAEDRRRIILALTPTGWAANDAVRKIENEFYEFLDAAAAQVDVSAVIELLRFVSAGSPAARALQNRIDAQGG
ncbi:MarR family winged helix-turn-helix transcriptional regulator [Streptomyces sp. NBC_01198]|uniref:MarR family winged helix-turn-helix transcriptional regulator n=1 Tax=Streptomyces sp. NBC_01198 TaxID=2903769 RepID=UPI002E0D5FBF|nr:MarR family transcriptional regulator [Streptomyces sp. NBC_01198]